MYCCQSEIRVWVILDCTGGSEYGWLGLAPPCYRSYIPSSPLPCHTMYMANCTNYKTTKCKNTNLQIYEIHNMNINIQNTPPSSPLQTVFNAHCTTYKILMHTVNLKTCILFLESPCLLVGSLQ